MLQVDLRELARGPVEMRADLAGTDPLFEGLEVTLAEPVQVAGRLQDAGDGRFYWRAPPPPRKGGGGRGCPPPGRGPRGGGGGGRRPPAAPATGGATCVSACAARAAR